MNQRLLPSRHWRLCWPLLVAACMVLIGHGGKAATEILPSGDGTVCAAGGPAAELLAPDLPAAAANEVEPISGPPLPGAKDRLDESAAAVSCEARAVRTCSNHLLAEGRHAPQALRRSALLFPFHFFW